MELRKKVHGRVALFGLLVLGAFLLALIWIGLFRSSDDSEATSALQLAPSEVSAAVEQSPALPTAEAAEHSSDRGSVALAEKVQREPVEIPLSGFSLQLVGPDGIPAPGTVFYGRFDEEFRARVLGPRRLGENLWGPAVLAETTTDTATIFFPDLEVQPEQDFLLVFAPGFAPKLLRLKDLPSTEADGMATLTLQPVDPITIHVRGEGGVPLAGGKIFLWYEPTTEEAWIADSDPAWSRLRIQFSLLHDFCDAAGDCTFASVFPQDNRLEIRPGNSFVSQAKLGLESGTEMTIEAVRGLTLTGKIVDTGGKGLGAVALAVYANHIASDTRALSRFNEEDGSFELQGIPAQAERLLLVAACDGYAHAMRTWTGLEAGMVLESRIVLQAGTGGQLQIQTPQGEGVGPGWLWLENQFGSGKTDAVEVGEDGVVVLPTQYEAQKNYACTLRLGGITQTLPQRFHLQPQIKLLLPHLARFQAMKATAPGQQNWVQVRWIPTAPEYSGSTSWNPYTPSPWLPSGPGQMEFQNETEQLVVEARDLAEGSDQLLAPPAVPSSFLAFNLPREDQGSGWELYNNEAFFLASGGVESLPVQFPCAPGTYRLIYWNSTQVADMPDVQVPPGGRNLGLLQPNDGRGGNLFGSISHADGSPWGGYRIAAKSSADVEILSVATEANGSFYLQGLPPGRLALVGRGESIFGIPGADFTQEAVVESGQSVGPLKIVLGSAESQLRGQVNLDGVRTATAFLHQGRLATTLVDADGNFFLPAPEQQAAVGVCVAAANTLALRIQKISAQEQHVQIRGSSPLHHFQMQDNHGVALANLQVRAHFRGVLLPAWCHSDANGDLELSYPNVADLSFLFLQQGRVIDKLAAAELPQQGPIRLASNSSQKTFLFPDASGTPRLDVTVLDSSGFSHYYPAPNGEVEVPDLTSESYSVFSPRTFTVHLGAQLSGSISLPQRLEGFQVEAVKAVKSIHYVCASALVPGLEVRGMVERGAANLFHLPDLPAGSLSVEAFAADGSTRWVHNLSIQAETPRLLR